MRNCSLVLPNLAMAIPVATAMMHSPQYKAAIQGIRLPGTVVRPIHRIRADGGIVMAVVRGMFRRKADRNHAEARAMSRTFVHEALVLLVRASGESNRDATFLTADAGIVRATVFGGPKSSLRAYIAPFHRGTLWLYHDPVRDSRKVTDFDVRSWRPGLRESLDRSLSASTLAETILVSHGGGGAWERALELANEQLDALETADDDACRHGLARFLWKWSEFLGARPEMDSCGSCGNPLKDDETVWYSRIESCMFCRDCAGKDSSVDDGSSRGILVPLNPGARKWLSAVDRMDARSALRIGLAPESEAQARRLCSIVLEEATGTRLQGWNLSAS